MDFRIISLLVLALVVAIGFNKKINIAFFSIGAAFLLGMAGGVPVKAIVGGFSSSMFVTLVGVTFLFGMASANGTLDLFSKKVVALVGETDLSDPHPDVRAQCLYFRHRARAHRCWHPDDYLCGVPGL